MTLEDDLEAIEGRVLGRPDVAAWLEQIDRLRVLLAMDAPGIEQAVRSLVAPKLEVTLDIAALEAFSTGVHDALITAGLNDEVDVDRARRRISYPGSPIRSVVPDLDVDLASALMRALQLAAVGAATDAYLAPLFGAATKTRMTVADIVTGRGNAGVLEVGKATKKPMVWVAERNACVRCLAHQGHAVTAGDDFPAGLTYGPKAYDDAIKAPPLHPNCRCHLEVLNAPVYADALKREADRSVLRGFSLESEAMSTRVYAADKLLSEGVDAPKSVKAYAKSAVKRGRFTKRTVGNA